MMKILIENGTLITLDGSQSVLEHADLYLQGNVIAAVAPDDPPFSPDQADKIIDADGCHVLPGFVNAHGHLALGIFRGLGEFYPGLHWPDYFQRQGALASQIGEDEYRLSFQILLAEMIRAGITSFADIHHERAGAFPLTDWIAQAVQETGMRAVLSLEATGYINIGGNRLRHENGEVDRTITKSLEFADKWHEAADGRITVMIGLAAPPVPMRYEMERIKEEASETGLAIQMHVAEIAYEMVEWQELYQSGPVAVLQEVGLLDHHILGGNVIYLDEEDAEILGAYPFHASTCPQNCCKMTLGMLDIPLMLEYGVNVCLGTNEVVTNNNLDMVEEMRFAALYHKIQRGDPTVLWGDQPLRLVTERGGRALGLNVGVLEEGRLADVIIMDATGPHMVPAHDPLANLIYSSSAADTKTVIIDGQVVMEDRKILTFDDKAVAQELETRLEPMRYQIPTIEPGVSSEPFELKWEVDR
jgi:5-methylthioadenosine/S-adenosylhomocysteine deaminase